MKCFIAVQYRLVIVFVCLASLGRRLKNKEKPPDTAQEDGKVPGSDHFYFFILSISDFMG